MSLDSNIRQVLRNKLESSPGIKRVNSERSCMERGLSLDDNLCVVSSYSSSPAKVEAFDGDTLYTTYLYLYSRPPRYLSAPPFEVLFE